MKYPGKYGGTVFDNNDPKGIGRVKALVPKVGFVTEPCTWARPNFPFPGMFIKLPIGTKVWIEFEGGEDLNSPIWTGIFYGAPGGKSEAPETAATAIAGDLIFEILTAIIGKANTNWEEEALSRIIEAASIKLGRTATLGLILESFGLNKYNVHTHNVTAVGSPTGPPLPPATFVVLTDATQKVKGE